ncbi:hypothetical protein E4634_01515 [Mangrovimicrobium sediminis]|uniref:IPTL-CTERM sorting domain-containing protein n=1 Tax=Mangrovimicrobium sediminis TaxID=2562682 RepID=A0A4Z0M9Q7_9GAMM|nr:hypothetical protein [Haliea sp. SAOS-164]TGD76249.1 hypothetical protein E4634_01515 [Haliea sp. SAOS-164]
MQLRNTLVPFVVATAIIALAPVVANAGTLTLNGELLPGTDPWWYRPLTPGDTDGNYTEQGTCAALDVDPDPVPYHIWEFHVTEAGLYDITMTPDDPGTDGQLVLYGPGAPYPGEFGDTACLGNIDDAATGESCCPTLSLDLEAGVTYTLVVTTYDDDESGPYAVVIAGPGSISTDPLRGPEAVPAAPYWLLAGLAAVLGAVASVRLRRRTD